MIPVFKVNYRVSELIKAFFIQEKSQFWRDYLIAQIKSFIGSENILLSSSCRNSIYQILKVLPQSKVIIPAYTCEVVAQASIMAGKQLVFAHISPDTFNVVSYPEIDEDSIVIVTHQFGNPVEEIENLIKICQNKSAPVIEDCAGSLGTLINGQYTGTMGDFGVFSFSASKTLQSVTRGSFIVVKDANNYQRLSESYERTKKLSIQFKIKQLIKGFLFKFNSSSVGCRLVSVLKDNNINNHSPLKLLSDTDFSYCRELYEWQAYILSKQFRRLDSILYRRGYMVLKYKEGITNSIVKKPKFSQDANYIRYPVLVEQRSKFIDYCHKNGIQVGTGYSAPVIPPDFTVEQTINKNIVYLPLGAEYSETEILKIIKTINEFRY